MICIHKKFSFESKGQLQFIDITDDVKRFLKESKLQEGIVNVFTRHTTTSIKINEREDGFHHDFKIFMKELLPMDRDYKHNDFEIRDRSTMCEIEEECINGHSHCQQMLVGSASEHIPVIGGEMQLGRWQRIFLIELDKPRTREVIVTVLGV